MDHTSSELVPFLRRSTLAGLLIVGLAGVAAALLFSRPQLTQSLAYHNFADQRTVLGVPHFANVVSNVPFLVIGLWGIALVLRRDRVGPEGTFLVSGERWPYLLLFIGVGLTGLGSAYYHLAPDNERLVWDRLPMAVGFMALFSAMIVERISVKWGLRLLPVLVIAGLGSVLYWHWSDDLRPYYLVQFYPGVAIPLMLLLFPPRYTGSGYLFAALGCHVLAKWCEYPLDETLFQALGQVVSGHTLKHLLAALGVYLVLLMLQRRRPDLEPFANGERGQS